MIKKIKLNHTYLGFPVWMASKEDQKLELLEIFCEGEKIMEFQIPANEHKGNSCDYVSCLNMKNYVGRELSLNGQFPSCFFKGIIQTDKNSTQADAIRPEIHYTAPAGWINDPNGLIYADQTWHMYYQYNPFNIEWENMSWGSAFSSDLLHWESGDVVLVPDENGLMFSGCGLVNERGLLGLPKDALIYFYTAAGLHGEWSKDKLFTQRIAYSLDGGKSFQKYEGWKLDTIAKDNRDPKIFWHEDSQAYIMCLWIQGSEFAIFRSSDLLDWKQTQLLDIPPSWECPDLFELSCEDGTKSWVFWSADSDYLIGTFDGYKFQAQTEVRKAYANKIPYAAQTWSGVKGEVISTAWLRVMFEGQPYRGAMSIPRKLELKNTPEGKRVAFGLPGIVEKQLKSFLKGCHMESVREDISLDQPYLFHFQWKNGTKTSVIQLNDLKITVDFACHQVQVGEEAWEFSSDIQELTIINDRGVLEITGNYGIMYAIVETKPNTLKGSIEYHGEAFTHMEGTYIGK